MSSLQVYLDGIGVYGPGLSGWQQTAEVLTGRAALVEAPPVLPPIEALPPAERRRAGLPIKLAFATGFEALRQASADPAQLRTVFASSDADCDNCHAILETLASADRAVSPTRFHNSVHNAPSGYWSIAAGSRAASTSLCAYDGSFAAGLLEAATQVGSFGQPCLLLAYDMPYCEPLAALRPIRQPFGVALLLSPQKTPATRARLALQLTPNDVTGVSAPDLERLRAQIPAARSLPLLQRLAHGAEGSVTLEYLEGVRLEVEVRHAA